MHPTSKRLALALVLAFGLAACSGETDQCTGVACGSHAHCSLDTGVCICDEGYGGDPAKGCSGTAKCESTTCSGHGTCDDSTGTANCICEQGYVGTGCAQCDEGYVRTGLGFCVADPCRAQSCGGHGACSVDANGNPECACAEGYAGAACAECAEGFVQAGEACVADPCVDGACSGHGSCAVDLQGAAVCACNGGYQGSACAECAHGYVEFPAESGTCISDPCLTLDCGHGACGLDAQGAARCACETGYAGATCSLCASGYTENPSDSSICVVQLCGNDTCSNHGTCEMASATTTRCLCNTGYSGGDCSSCASGFVADPVSHTLCIENLCAPGSCSGHGTCTMASTGVLECSCNTGYQGEDCSGCASGFVPDPQNPTACIQDLCSPSSCSSHGSCTMVSAGNFACSCSQGYAGSSCNQCDDRFVPDPIDTSRCIENLCSQTTCSQHGTCSMASAGNTRCACSAGYEGAICSACADGYVTDPLNTSACVANTCNGSTCSGHGTCAMTGTGARCTCEPGYSGTACDQCAAGFVPDPTVSGVCIRNTCTDSTCSGHGSCSMASANTTRCACSEGYEGAVCASCTTGFVPDPTNAGACIVNQCNAQSCSGHGSCSMASANVTQCACAAGYQGATCTGCAADYVADPTSPGSCIRNTCAPSTCSGHGTCSMASAGVTSCACAQGYVGADCSDCSGGYVADPTAPANCIPNICTASTCSGHGDCTMASLGVTTCSCDDGYTGTSCGSCDSGWTADPANSGACIVDLCTASACSGHGLCAMVSAGNLGCSCDQGYAGNRCESCATGFVADPTTSGRCISNLCTGSTCSGHGSCSMASDGVTSCACSAGYAGASCAGCATDYVVFPAGSGTCIADPCKNVDCALSDRCNAAGTGLIEYTGVCVVLGVGSHECSSTESPCATGACSSGACETYASPIAGELAITEIMIEPAVAAALGQWFEVQNVSTGTRDLAGMVVSFSGTRVTLPATPVVLAAGDRLVVGKNGNTATNGGVALDVVLSGAGVLEKSLGYVDLFAPNGTTQVESVVWDGTWNHRAGKSLTLSPAAIDPANENDVAESWCYAQAGTSSPGSENAPCEVDWCAVQPPLTVAFAATLVSDPVYAQVYEAGFTEGNNPSSFIKAQLGWGADGSTPGTSWTWADAAYNAGFSTTHNNEEFVKSLSIAAQGSYDYAYRMSFDGGLSWKLCEQVGSAQVGAPPPAKVIFSEYVEGTSFNKAIELFNADTNPLWLARCSLSLHSSAAVTPTQTVTLPELSLSPGGAFVLCHESADAGIRDRCDLVSNAVVNFNGDDALVLKCDAVVHDVIGKLGADPGAAWAANGVSTLDQTLRRKCGVLTGDTDGADAFDPSRQWKSFPIDTRDGLGSHDPVCPDPCLGVTCSDRGTCQASGDTTYTCACDAGYAGDSCNSCDSGYAALPVSPLACVDDPCVPDMCSGHGTCSMLADGSGSCACATGYAGASCSSCATDYVLEAGACIHTKTVDCANVAPVNAASTVVPVTVTYTTGSGWSAPAECAWNCNSGYVLEGGACINSKSVPCNSSGTPSNATATVTDVTITYSGTSWSAPAACAWDCNSGYVLEGGACINSKSVPCNSSGTPSNATATVTDVTITYSGTSWSAPAACAWNCDSGYAQEGGACINSKSVPCNSSGTPSNATATVTDVTITYSGTSWSAPAACAWDCDTDYGLVGGACLNRQDVNCADNAPANATATPAIVTITYTTAGGWTTPASCAWTCNSGFHLEGANACVANVDLSAPAFWCSVQDPKTYSAAPGATKTIFGQVYVPGVTDPAGQAPGIQSLLCYSASAIAYPVDLSALACTDAAFNPAATNPGNNDEYMADLLFSSPGTYNYVFAFTGDGGASWKYCDANGVVGDPVEPGVATVSLPVCSPSQVVISQVYGGGGQSGAPYKNDFVEIHNRGVSEVALGTWSIQYAASTGSSWQAQALSGKILPGAYYLVQLGSAGAVGVALPTPDATGSIGMAGSAGKVALVNQASLLAGSCPTGSNVIDFVGYGAGTNCSEGNTPTGSLSSTSAALRNGNGCTDTTNNSADFTVDTPAPRNSASPAVTCGCN